MVTSTGLWLRSSNSLHVACPSLQTLKGGKGRSKTGVKLNVQKWPMQESSHYGGRKSSGSLSDSRMAFLMYCNLLLHHHHLHLLCRLVNFPNF